MIAILYMHIALMYEDGDYPVDHLLYISLDK